MEPLQSASSELRDQEREAAQEIVAMQVPRDQKEVLQAILEIQQRRNTAYINYLTELRELHTKYDAEYEPLDRQRLPAVGQVPDFWLRVMKNSTLASSYIYAQDERLLKQLLDIRYWREEHSDNFTLEFEFAPNDFIENQVLSKTCIMTSAEHMKRAEGTEIVWKKVNLTRKGTGKPLPSFFNFFRDVSRPEEEEKKDDDSDEELADKFEDDYDLACEFRDEVIPNAVLFYLNVRNQHDSSDDDFV